MITYTLLEHVLRLANDEELLKVRQVMKNFLETYELEGFGERLRVENIKMPMHEHAIQLYPRDELPPKKYQKVLLKKSREPWALVDAVDHVYNFVKGDTLVQLHRDQLIRD